MQGNLLTSWGTISFPRRAVLHWVSLNSKCLEVRIWVVCVCVCVRASTYIHVYELGGSIFNNCLVSCTALWSACRAYSSYWPGLHVRRVAHLCGRAGVLATVCGLQSKICICLSGIYVVLHEVFRLSKRTTVFPHGVYFVSNNFALHVSVFMNLLQESVILPLAFKWLE
jgi:hypothetical protein